MHNSRIPNMLFTLPILKIFFILLRYTMRNLF